MAEHAHSFFVEFSAAIAVLLENPPDPNEPVPLWNQKGIAYGITISIQVLGWLFVGFRLHTRIRVVREPGLDDLFVVLAALFNLLSLIGFLCSMDYGVGHHIIYVLFSIQKTMIFIYITSIGYCATTFLIKVSLLLQYLRMFKSGSRRIVCIVLLGLVVVWGLIVNFMSFFPCFPVAGFWDKTLNAKCYGLGYRTAMEVKNTMIAFAASNMIFDVAIFAIPLTEYFRKDLRRKELMAMTGLLTFGAFAVLMSVLRLWATFKHSQQSVQTFDFLFWLPLSLIISFVEVGFAIMCASMPIFWPTIVATFSQIFVTSEVYITSQERLASDSQEKIELGNANSIGGTKRLTRVESEEHYAFDNGYITETVKCDIYATGQVEVRPPARRSVQF